MSDTPDTELMHASCVSWEGKGVLIAGGSGSGKSTTALALMAHGAQLVADDQVIVTRTGEDLTATCPDTLSGLIESRGIGILAAEPAKSALVTLIVDMDQTELHRLPPHRNHEILGVSVNTVFGRDSWGLVPGVLALLKGQRLR